VIAMAKRGRPPKDEWVETTEAANIEHARRVANKEAKAFRGNAKPKSPEGQGDKKKASCPSGNQSDCR